MLKGIKLFKGNNFRDKRGLLWTSWISNKKSLKFNHDKFSLSKKMFSEVFIMIIKLGN